KKEDDMGACIEKLDKVGWAVQDPMYDIALLLFGQSADYRKLWLHLKPESCGNWVKSVGKKRVNSSRAKKAMPFKPVPDPHGQVPIKFNDSALQIFLPFAPQGKIASSSGTPKNVDGMVREEFASPMAHGLESKGVWHKLCSGYDYLIILAMAEVVVDGFAGSSISLRPWADFLFLFGVLSRKVLVDEGSRQHGVATDDVHSVAMSSRLDAIRSIYGVSIARNLIKVDASDSNPSSSVFEIDGLISDSNYSAKKTTMVLFINEPTFIVTLFAERLFECSALKRTIKIVYAATLPKASKLFIYMSIGLPPNHVDVNVHPTKT
nr:DNA mismatch repair protein MLH1 isoform X2 [Tanacetum cinerariifolium]GEY51239.1 DNA mismatch repair protein MLH1 isoform X2 [Tanacetum cinerariifolium]